MKPRWCACLGPVLLPFCRTHRPWEPHCCWASPTLASLGCSGTTEHPTLALPEDAASAASPSPPVPSCCCFPLRATAAGWEGHRTGQDRAPVIALQSLGILPHQINAGAITTDLFYTQRALLGTSPSTGWEIQGVGGAGHPGEPQPPHKGHECPCSPGARREGNLLLKHKLCLLRATFFHSSSGQEQPGLSGNPW